MRVDSVVLWEGLLARFQSRARIEGSYPRAVCRQMVPHMQETAVNVVRLGFVVMMILDATPG